MVTVKHGKKSTANERQNRYFSEDFKRKKVDEIDKNITSIAEVCREYEVSSAAVYKWIYKFSGMRKRGVKQVVEAKSDTRKIAALKEQIKELERAVGQKQIKIDLLEKTIELAEEEYGVAIKKNSSTQRFTGFGTTGKDTIIP